MSMNLWCKQVDLRQTPTYITETIALNHEKKLDNWKDIRYRYLRWLKGEMLESMPRTREDYKDFKEIYKEHEAELMSYNKLDFEIV